MEPAATGTRITVSVEPAISNWIVLPAVAWFFVALRSVSTGAPFDWPLGILLTIGALALAAVAHFAEGSSIESALSKIVAVATGHGDAGARVDL